MGIKPLIVASRYKFILAIPFAIIIPIAAVLSILNLKTTYTSTARLFVNESAVLDNLVDGNAYASPAQNRANDINELMLTDRFRFAVAQKVDPSLTEETAAGLMYQIAKCTAAYANGRRLLVVSCTTSDQSSPRVIAQALVDAFKEQFSESIGQKAAIYLDTQNTQKAQDQAALKELQDKRDQYVVAFRGDASRLFADAQYQSYSQEIDRIDGSIRATEASIKNAQASLDAAQRNQDDYFLSTQDAARDPSGKDPIGKKKLIALPAAGFLIALSLSAALYAFLFRTDNRIRTVEDLRSIPGVLLLGTVPDVTPVRRRRWPRNFFRIAVAGLGVTGQR